MNFHAIVGDIETDKFVFAPEISNVSDENKEKEYEFCINLKKN